MFSKIKSFSKQIQLYIYLVLLFITVNSYIIQQRLFSSQKIATSLAGYGIVQSFFYYIALLVIAYLIAVYEFNWRFLLKFPLIYLLYCFISYIFTFALNLNNPDFVWQKFVENGFFQANFILTALLLVTMIIIFKVGIKYTKLLSFIPKFNLDGDFDNIFISQFIISLILLDNKFISIIPKMSSIQLLNETLDTKLYTEQHFWTVIAIIVYLSFLGTIMSYCAIRGMRDFVHNRSSFSLAFISSALLAIICDLSIQLSLGLGVPYNGVVVYQGAISFQFLILFVGFLLVYLIINRYLAASIILLFLSSVFAYANFIKVGMRGEPILPSDLVWILRPKTLFGFVDDSAFIYIFVLVFIVFAILYFIRKKLFANPIIRDWKIRLTLTILLLSFLLAPIAILSQKKDNKIVENIPILSVLQNSEYIAWLGNLNHARYKSLAYIWFSQLSTPVMDRPSNYSADTMKKIEAKYKKTAEELNQSRTENISDQTVIYILSESFADPARVDGVSMSQNPIPYIQEVKSNTTSGLMKSDGYGGGTANMEFQTLTSLPFYNLSPSVSVMYTEVVPQMNKFPSISDLYSPTNRYAIHLASGANYSRNEIYKKLGFNTFINTDDEKNEYQKEGFFPSDQSTYQYILDEIDKKGNQFFSVMTMQNHGVWSEDNPADVTAQGEGFDSQTNAWLTSYVRLLTHTDTATKDFLEKLSQLDKKITVVFYGDHLPGLYPSSAFLNNPDSQYQTDYFIWSNYETPKLDYPLVNSSDFSALMLEQTNSKVSPYYALLTNVLHHASVDKTDLDEEAQQISDDMKLVEYDIVSGRGYLSKDFFKVVNN